MHAKRSRNSTAWLPFSPKRPRGRLSRRPLRAVQSTRKFCRPSRRARQARFQPPAAASRTAIFPLVKSIRLPVSPNRRRDQTFGLSPLAGRSYGFRSERSLRRILRRMMVSATLKPHRPVVHILLEEQPAVLEPDRLHQGEIAPDLVFAHFAHRQRIDDEIKRLGEPLGHIVRHRSRTHVRRHSASPADAAGN